MPRYYKRLDANNQPIDEAITEIKEVRLNTDVSLTDEVVSVPVGAYGFVVKRLPVDATIKVNGQLDPVTIDAGDILSPFLHEVQSLTITTTSTSTNPIVLQFLT